MRLGVAVADIAAGMFAFQGLLLALIARGRTGRGQWVDVGLLDSVVALLSYQASRHLLTGDRPTRAGNRHLTIAPYDTFDARGGVLVLAVGTDSQFRKLCDVLGRDDVAGDPRFATNALRVTHYDALQPVLAREFAARDLDDVIAVLHTESVPCGAVRSVDEALADPQVIARAMVESVDHPDLGMLRMLGVPVKLSGTPGSVRTPPPRLGEHTREVLRDDLGLDDNAMRRLAETGAFGSALQDDLRNRR